MKEKRGFSIFDFAHVFWEKIACKGDWAIDATCGNGHDMLALLGFYKGVLGLDIQEKAIHATKRAIPLGNYELYCQSHVTFPKRASELPIRLIVYNLGYLPGGNKNLTTLVDSTLKSVEGALELILPGGMVSLTCYPGHEEGKKEQEALLAFTSSLPKSSWSVSHHIWNNRKNAPSLLLISKY